MATTTTDKERFELAHSRHYAVYPHTEIFEDEDAASEWYFKNYRKTRVCIVNGNNDEVFCNRPDH